MLTAIRNFAQSAINFIAAKLAYIRLQAIRFTNWIIDTLINAYVASKREKLASKIAIVSIPVINFGIAVHSFFVISDTMILLDYILYASMSEWFYNLLVFYFWQNIVILIVSFVVVMALNKLWRYIAMNHFTESLS